MEQIGGKVKWSGPLWKLSQVEAEVPLLHGIPPNPIRFGIKLLSNTQAEIITLCHAIVEPHMVFVTLNNLSVEIVVGHEFLSNKGSMEPIGAKVNPPNHHLCLWV
jgi:hypothetical protein